MAESRAPAQDYSRDYLGVRTVVFGATGFIGRWVARTLSAAGAKLTLPVRDQSAARDVFDVYEVAGEVQELDARDDDGLRALLHHVGPAIVFNLVGYGVDRRENVAECAYKINADLIANVCAAMAEIAVPAWKGQSVIHVGTAMEYGATGGDLSESGPTQPTTLYGRSKLAGTRAVLQCCRHYHLKGLTARLFAVYGPGESRDRLLPSLVDAASTYNQIPLTAGRHERDFVYVEDVAEGLLRLGLTSVQSGEPVNVATGRLSSIRAFTQIAAGVLGIPDHRLEFGVLPTRPEEMRHGPVTIERLRSLTEWKPPTTIVEGVRKTMAFEQRSVTLRAAHHGW